MALKKPSKFDLWLRKWLQTGPLWLKCAAFLLFPWPLSILAFWPLGMLKDEGHIDWWNVFGYPLGLVGCVLTHVILVWLGSYSWQRESRNLEDRKLLR